MVTLSRRKIRTNSSGAMEGLPMQLLIIVIIAAVAIAIVLGWLYMIDDPQIIDTVTADPSMVEAHGTGPYVNDSFDVTIKVWDQDDSAISGAVVEISGGGLVGSKVVGTTDGNGVCIFTDLSIELGTDQTTTMDVKVTKADYESGSTEIVVVCVP